jgi:hypothetical protein
MSEPLDGPLVLRERESSVLVHRDSMATLPEIDTTARLGDDRVVAVDIRFSRLPSRADLAAEDDVVLVAPAEAGSFGDVPVYTVEGPENLTGYGMAMTEVLEDYDEPLLVRLDSLTALLQHVSVNAAFRFVHVLSGRVDRERAVLVASLDPGAHDTQTVATMTQPFDVVVTGEQGTRRVRRRG